MRNWIVVLLLTACSEKTANPTAACSDLSQFELSGCDASSLAQLQHEGAWNLQLRFPDGATSAASFSLIAGGENVFGRPLEEKNLSDSAFYLSTQYVSRRSGRTIRSALAGCRASSPTQVEGKLKTCVDGQLVTEATFEARRVVRRTNEQEAENLNLVGEAPVAENEAVDVAIEGARAFVVALEGGVTVFDITDRSKPLRVSHIPSDGEYWNDVEVVGDVLYVASATKGVVLYDVKDPAAPVRLPPSPVGDLNVHTLLKQGQTLFAMSPSPVGETVLLDVTSPASPVELSRHRSPGSDPAKDDHPHDASFFEGRLYVNHWARGTVVADVTERTEPKELARIPGTSTTSHFSQVGRVGADVILFEGGEDWGAGLELFDVTDVAAATRVGAFSLRPEVSIHNFVLKGTTVFAAWYQDGLRVIDVSDPAAPRQLGYFNTWRQTDPFRGTSFYDGAIGVKVPGDGFIYLAESGRGLLIFDEPLAR